MSPVNMDRITLIAFSPDIVRQAKRMVPEMRVLLLYDLDGNDSDNAAVSTVDELLSLAGSIRADGLGPGQSPGMAYPRCIAIILPESLSINYRERAHWSNRVDPDRGWQRTNCLGRLSAENLCTSGSKKNIKNIGYFVATAFPPKRHNGNRPPSKGI